MASRLTLCVSYLAIVAVSIFASGAVAARWNAPNLVEARETQYNDIWIVRRGDLLSLLFRHGARAYSESTLNVRDPLQLISPYVRAMMAALFYARDLGSVLDIGFGAGRTASYVHAFVPGARVTSVELDPDVIDLARKHFDLREDERFRVVARDGRMFLAGTNERYDVIMIDAYRGPFVPFHLLTREFYALVASHLTEGGVLVQNVEPSTMVFDAAAKTIGAVFPHVDGYRAGHNIVLVAYGGAERPAASLAAAAVARQEAHRFRYDLRELLRDRFAVAEERQAIDPNAAVLTDDFAPVDALQAIRRHNRRWASPQ